MNRKTTEYSLIKTLKPVECWNLFIGNFQWNVFSIYTCIKERYKKGNKKKIYMFVRNKREKNRLRTHKIVCFLVKRLLMNSQITFARSHSLTHNVSTLHVCILWKYTHPSHDRIVHMNYIRCKLISPVFRQTN